MKKKNRKKKKVFTTLTEINNTLKKVDVSLSKLTTMTVNTSGFVTTTNIQQKSQTRLCEKTMKLKSFLCSGNRLFGQMKPYSAHILTKYHKMTGWLFTEQMDDPNYAVKATQELMKIKK